MRKCLLNTFHRFSVQIVRKLIIHFVSKPFILVTGYMAITGHSSLFVQNVLYVKCADTKSTTFLIKICKQNKFSYLLTENCRMDDLTLCDDCIEVRLRKEYCPICNKRWDNVQSHLTKEEIEMIECQCQMWVHKYCDSELSKEVFKEFSLTGRAYHCPNCRRSLKNKQLADFISILVE